METMNRQDRIRALAALTIAVVMWGSAFVAIRGVVASEAFTPGQLSAARLIVASVLLAGWAVVRGLRMPQRRDWPWFLLLGASGQGLYQLLLNTGERTVDAGTASLLVSTAPIIAAVLAVAFLGERMSARKIAGTVVAFAGAAAIALGAGGGLRFDPGVGIIVVATCVWALFLVVQKTLAGRYDSFELTAWPIWIGTALLLPFAGGLPDAVVTAPLAATASVVWLGAFSSVVGFVAWAYAIQRLDVVTATSSLYCVPVAAFLIGLAFLGEVPHLSALLGSALVLGGVVLMQTKRATGHVATEAVPEAD